MSNQREEFKAWLDRATHTEGERVEAADRIWSRRRARVVPALIVATAAAVVLGLWWDRGGEPATTSAPPPDAASRLMLSAAGDEVRIEVGVRRGGER